MGLTERERTGYIYCIDLSGTIYSEFINPGCESGYKISESHVALAYEASATHCNAYPYEYKIYNFSGEDETGNYFEENEIIFDVSRNRGAILNRGWSDTYKKTIIMSIQYEETYDSYDAILRAYNENFELMSSWRASDLNNKYGINWEGSINEISKVGNGIFVLEVGDSLIYLNVENNVDMIRKIDSTLAKLSYSDGKYIVSSIIMIHATVNPFPFLLACFLLKMVSTP